MHVHDKVIHDLLCMTLREINVATKGSNLPENFHYQLGVALHNIPQYLRDTGTIPTEVCLELNALDPSAKSGAWGEWVRATLSTLGQDKMYPT